MVSEGMPQQLQVTLAENVCAYVTKHIEVPHGATREQMISFLREESDLYVFKPDFGTREALRVVSLHTPAGELLMENVALDRAPADGIQLVKSVVSEHWLQLSALLPSDLLGALRDAAFHGDLSAAPVQQVRLDDVDHGLS